MNRIYCKNCMYLFLPLFWYSKWFDDEYNKEGTSCTHYKNIVINDIGDFFEHNTKRTFLLKPSEINKDNDCPLFEEGEHPGNVALRKIYKGIDETDRINS